MKKNMGIADRVIRILIAAAFIGGYFAGFIEGTLGYVLLALGAIFILTSAVSFCPLYLPFGLKTCKNEE